jgi:hypothetical protein
MTYVPNMIRIPTHGVDTSHQGVGFGERTRKHQWSRRKLRRGEEMKKERKEEEREREGCHFLPGSHARLVGTTHKGVTPTDIA